MLVLASTALTVVIIVAVVLVLGVVLLAFGPLSRGERSRDDIEAEMGPLGVTRVGEEAEESKADHSDLYSEERLDREFE
ncbi:MAG TPA: hypothetical protein VGI69_04065 [Gaiellaceae bacterium]|jgi:hypothetical protein